MKKKKTFLGRKKTNIFRSQLRIDLQVFHKIIQSICWLLQRGADVRKELIQL